MGFALSKQGRGAQEVAAPLAGPVGAEGSALAANHTKREGA